MIEENNLNLEQALFGESNIEGILLKAIEKTKVPTSLQLDNAKVFSGNSNSRVENALYELFNMETNSSYSK